MFVKNYNPHINAQTEYLGLRQERKYWCPYFVKYVTWFLVVGIVISSSVVLALYGMSFGMIKTYLWLSTLLSSIIISIIVITPLRIFIFSILDAVFIKRKPTIISRKIHPSLLANPENPEKKQQVLKYRQFNANLYAPVPLFKLQNRLEDVKYNIQLRNVTSDFTSHVFFMMVIIYIIRINQSEMEYYSTEIIKDLVVRGNYTKSIPFLEVTTYEMFLEYLNETFLPALLPIHTDYSKPNWSIRKRRVQEFNGYPNLPADVKKRQILNDFANLENYVKKKNGFKVFQKGWTLSPNLKLLGKPRLRQVRVKTGTCKQLLHLEGRKLKCAVDLTPFNVEKGEFTLEWEPGPPKGLTTSQAIPWRYQSARDTQSLPVYGKYRIYPGGGYVLALARDINDARIILEFLDAFQWVDMRTRAVLIEFTVYCVNTNLFNVVTLIVEKTASGYIIPTYQIHTGKLTFMPFEFEIEFMLMSFLLVSCLTFFMFREGLKIHRTTIATYLKRGFAWFDLAVIFLGLVSVTFILCRSYYISQLLESLEKCSNNEFVSFIYAAFWHSLSIYIEALLVCICFFKLFRLLTFRVVFFQLQTILSHCYSYFTNLFAKQMVLILAFAFFFNLALANYSYGFSSFDVSLSTMIWRAVALDDNFKSNIFINSPWYLGPLFFGLFVIVVTIFFTNMFIVVICLYLREIQKNSLLNKYNILEYIKYALLSGRQRDILHLKERKPFREEASDPTVMRLKGGGNRSSKKKTKKGRKGTVKKRPQKEDGEEESMKIKSSHFITKKPYDTTEYRDLTEERAIGMKYLMLSYISEEEEVRSSREQALKALFCSFTATRAKAQRGNSAYGRYFFVADKSGTVLYDSDRFLQMKKVIEDKAREKGWLEDEEGNLGESSEGKDKLSALNEKLCLLLRKGKRQ